MIEKSLIDRLSPLVDGRVYFGVAPEDAAQPRLVIQTVSGGTGFTLAGWDGSSDLTIQLDAWGESFLQALTLAGEAFAVMTADGADFTTGGADRLPDEFESDTKLFSVSWEYTLQP
ncbi:tail completion protein gp17 [Pseudomonas sivasensis]|uniref:tail completion protein gp17 n=1 Tax=Pseudomonas sivasensis TaxID=1880678 RepID=UPI003B9E43B1